MSKSVFDSIEEVPGYDGRLERTIEEHMPWELEDDDVSCDAADAS